MTFQEAQREIESVPMAVRLNVASGLKTFLRAIQGERAVCQLRKMLDAKETQELVLTRLIELSRQHVDRRYENPWDTSLTIYLWLISSVNKSLLVLATNVVTQAPQCWWAQKLSSQLLREPEMHPKSSISDYSVTSQSSPAFYSALPASASALISLDTIFASTRPIRIHMPESFLSLSQTDNIRIYGDPSQDCSIALLMNTAANQFLSKAA